MRVVATAGHVDHGKSTLVRALTGMEPDRWAEERRRGMTIDLGFAWTTLPGSAEPVAFVDVPGHERFVTQMLAGVGPVPATMFVVAADSGWMPQSTEHLDALDALGVRDGLLVVTRSDLADPELARDEALEHLAESSLGRLPAVCVSGATGAGLDELRSALSALVGGLPAPDLDADVRLWVDRAFTVRGAGTVVTGTLGAGTIHVGDELALGSRTVTVRGLQALGESVDPVAAVARVALNLRGVGLDEVGRGDALTTPGKWLRSDVVDVRVGPPRGADVAVDLPQQVMLHVGSAAVAARVRPLSTEPGAERMVRLTLREPLPLRPGDHALLRDPGAHRVLGGVTVLDVRPPALRRRGAARARAGELAATDGTPDALGELARRHLMQRDELVALGASVPDEIPSAGGWLVDPGWLPTLASRLVAAVAAHAEAQPLDAGLPAKAAARALELPEPRLLDLVLAEPGASSLVAAGGRIRSRDAGGLPEGVRAAVATVRSELAEAPFAAPEAHRLAELGLRTRELGAAVQAGALLKVGDGIYLAPDAVDVAVARLAGLPSPFTLSEARQALGTTRRVAVPLLEYLARQGRTRRDDEGRHALR
ncbi:selenocysteine-specific translation elongation factor [Actinomycetospora straminea]|uniref:Selenocysteine-specific elongation factor n=1 Tax=Actinomycetospora straminea TaxID=663607 RepID=A0ABP9F4Z6_9PSEU|nr:selenocysteine-specific translation elongation factor [Actinomycetospora straminea]MDD7936109.1 selenocysteine-specific translation elongation factor [Actinomycetospora straminea]